MGQQKTRVKAEAQLGNSWDNLDQTEWQLGHGGGSGHGTWKRRNLRLLQGVLPEWLAGGAKLHQDGRPTRGAGWSGKDQLDQMELNIFNLKHGKWAMERKGLMSGLWKPGPPKCFLRNSRVKINGECLFHPLLTGSAPGIGDLWVWHAGLRTANDLNNIKH